MPNITDLGRMTYDLRDSATDLANIWLNQPWRHREFGNKEIADLRDAHLKLSFLLSILEAKESA